MITPEDFPGVAEDVARRILVAARSIAPDIDALPSGSEARKDAVAILRGIAAEVPPPGSRRVRSQSVTSARVEYWNADTWTLQDRDSLRALCNSPTPTAAPRGSFPLERPISRLWPETYS